MDLQELRNNLLKLVKPGLENKLLEIIGQNDEELINLNQEQLFSGIDSKSKFLKPPYASNAYANYKLKRNPLGVVDLKLTGAFYSNFFVSANEFPVLIGSADEKTFGLVQKYGENIFGLTKENVERLTKETILPKLNAYIRTTLKL